MTMADLRSRCERLGLEDVSTYIQTGNVLLSSSDSAAKVTTALEEELGTRAFVLTPAQLRKAAKENPLREDGWRSHLLFLERAPKKPMPAVEGYRFAVKGRVLYYAFPEQDAGARRSIDFERLLGVAGTGRSAKVVDELLERL
jgi:uncharacterized protein (DUF1697 family)